MMPTPDQHQRLRRKAIGVLAVIALLLLAHEIFGPHGYLAMRRQQKEFRALQQQVRTLEQKNKQLSQQIQALKSNPQAIEKIARERMHFARPGEIIYALPRQDPKRTPYAVGQGPKPARP